MNPELDEKVYKAVDKFRNVINNLEDLNPDQKGAIIQCVAESIVELEKLCKEIRAWHPLIQSNRSYRYMNRLITEHLSRGQAITSNLATWDLRDSVAYLIEEYYGIGFNSLTVRPLKSK